MKTLEFTPALRVDYQISNALAAERAVDRTPGEHQVRTGSLPGFNDTLQAFPLGAHVLDDGQLLAQRDDVPRGDVRHERRTGSARRTRPSSPTATTCVCPQDLAALVANCTLGAITFLYPGRRRSWIRGTTRRRRSSQVGFAFFQDGRALLPPQLNWAAGGTTSRLGNAPPSLNFPGFMNINRTQDVSISLTKIMGRHTMKAGFYLNHSYKAQNQGGAPSFQGALNFGNDTNNPLDAAYPFANAILGIFSSYGQSQRFMEGSFLYDGLDWYVQDNWKVNRKLTLGLRRAVRAPGRAVRPVRPVVELLRRISGGCRRRRSSTCRAAPARARAPATTGRRWIRGRTRCSARARRRSSARRSSARATSPTACALAGDGISDRAYQWPDLALRAAVRRRVRRDRQAADGPARQHRALLRSSRRQHRVLDGRQSAARRQHDVAVGIARRARREPALVRPGADRAGVLLRLEAAVRHAVEPRVPDGAPVGVVDRRLVRRTPLVQRARRPAERQPGADQHHRPRRDAQGERVRIRRRRPARRCRTTCCGRTAATTNIQFQWGRFERTYHSIQTNFNRRFRNGVSFQVNWTLGLSDKGNTDMPGGNPQLRLDHNADGSFTVRAGPGDRREALRRSGPHPAHPPVELRVGSSRLEVLRQRESRHRASC